MRKKLIIAGAALIVSLVAAAWLARTPLLVRYHVGRLETDDSAIEPVVELGEAAVPRLLEVMKRDTPATPRAALALERMLEQWPKGDPRCARVGEQVAASFSDFPPAVRQIALKLADALPGCGAPEAGGKIVQVALKDDSIACQEQAMQMALRPEFNLGAAVVPLLKDPKPEVRRSAMLALGEMKEVVPDEDLLPSLHDSDERVRALCEAALRWRGLRDKDIRLGRLVSDPSPLKRLEVLQHLPADNELDPQLWLQKLCQDPSPAVRASAARIAMDPASGLDVNLTDRVRDMAQHDPDGTVRQIAEYLIQGAKKPGNRE